MHGSHSRNGGIACRTRMPPMAWDALQPCGSTRSVPGLTGLGCVPCSRSGDQAVRMFRRSSSHATSSVTAEMATNAPACQR